MRVYLETERLVLRHFTADDLDLLIDLDREPGVKRYIDGDAPPDRDEVRHMLDRWCTYEQRFPDTGYGCWAALDRATGDFLGWFHLRPQPTDDPTCPELGYRLHRSAWGRGLATEGSRALVDRAFGELGATRVHASTMKVNVGSWQVMEKSGLRFVRLFHAEWPVRIDGDEEGDVEYAITRDDWLADRRRDGDHPPKPDDRGGRPARH